MSTDLLRYDLLVQDALKGVVRKVLSDATRDGLPGEHHFYISFRTDAPGVRLSSRLAEKYPQEMTIILQHQFWDLTVNEHGFEVGLSFSNIPEKLSVPFDALTGFFDPSVQFGLKFEIQELDQTEATVEELPVRPAAVPALPGKGQDKEPAKGVAGATPLRGKDPEAAPKKAETEAAETGEDAGEDAGANEPGAGAEVVSLDSFRKKS